jgi:hypothetical protein
MENKSITFGTLRKYLSIIDRLSICMKETLQYENFICRTDVPNSYDNLYVYGIGIIESKFYKVNKFTYAATGDRKNLTLAPCIEIMLSKEPRNGV